MAAIYEGVLAVWPVSPSGAPLGPPRHVTTESAHAPSWQGDSRHVLYQSLDQLRIVDIETGETATVPMDLKWTPAIPTTRTVVHNILEGVALILIIQYLFLGDFRGHGWPDRTGWRRPRTGLLRLRRIVIERCHESIPF